MKSDWIAAALLISLSAPVAANAQFEQFMLPGQSENRNDSIARDMQNIENEPSGVLSITGMRGSSNSGKPLGFYGFDENIVYRSGYQNVDAQTMARWAYDLHQFIVSAGGGWEKYQEYTSTKDAADAWSKSLVSYSKQRSFAKMYWQGKSGFDQVANRDAWINDALLDGNLLYSTYEQRAQIIPITYKDAEIGVVLQHG